MKPKNGTAMHIVAERLFTNEDPLHIHKTLGALCFLSYLVRYTGVGLGDMYFRNYPEWTVPTIVLHFMLSATSFIFHIPDRRIKNGGRIWPEMRLHSIIFTSRSLALMTLYYIEQRFNRDPNYFMNWGICMATMALADLSSQSVGKFHSKSVRDLDAPAYYKFFFSMMQFYATTVCLIGLRRFSLQMVAVTVIQTTAFTATLYRKNLVSHYFNIVFYAAQLLFTCAVSIYEHRILHDMKGSIFLIGNIAAIWRMGPWPKAMEWTRSKYIMWTALFLLLQYVVRPTLSNHPDAMLSDRLLALGTLISFLPLAGLAYEKCVNTNKVYQ